MLPRALLLLLTAAPAVAQEEVPVAAPSAFDLGADLGVMTDYRFRGVSRSDEGVAVQGRVTLNHDSGLYAGARATSLSGVDAYRLRALGDAQVDLYAGYGRSLGGGFDLDAGLMYFAFAGADGAATDYAEPYASLSYLIGPVSATAGAKYAPSQRALGDADMLYLFGQVDVTVPFRPWSFSGLVGHQQSGAFGDYWTWSLGGQYRLRIAGLPDSRLGLRYVDTDRPSTRGQDGALLLSVDVGF